MLDGVMGIVQFGADGTDPRALYVLEHPLHPVGIDRLDIVIEEKKDFGPGMLDAEVVDAGVIEGRRPGDYLTTRIATELCIIVEGFGLGAAVLDDYDFIVVVTRALDGGDAARKRGTVVFAWNDDG